MKSYLRNYRKEYLDRGFWQEVADVLLSIFVAQIHEADLDSSQMKMAEQNILTSRDSLLSAAILRMAIRYLG